MTKRRKQFQFVVTVTAPQGMTEKQARAELESMLPTADYALMSGFAISPKQVRPMPSYVAQFGDSGLNIEFYGNARAFNEAHGQVERMHDLGLIDQYLIGNVSI